MLILKALAIKKQSIQSAREHSDKALEIIISQPINHIYAIK